MARYLIRFDDINSRMDWDKFFILKKCLEKYNIKSILGVIPDCCDDFLFASKPFKKYYEYLRKYKSYGDAIAQHGYKHIYDSNSKGFFGSSYNSEFAGLNFKKQFKKLLKGKKILQRELIWEPIFMAPAHSFDSNTLICLRKLGFEKVLDGFSLFAYKLNDLTFVPQFSSKPLPKFLPCISQLCIHINTITPKELNMLIQFIEKNHSKFVSLENINPNKNVFFERIFIYLFVKIFRKMRKIIHTFKYLFLKFLCIKERIYFRIKFHKLDIDKWHLNGTFYCRKYKQFALEIINNLKPRLYIDIGCGLGELLSKVKLEDSLKIGYDKDSRLSKTQGILNNKFKFFSKEELFLNHLSKLKNTHKPIVISMLNFIHNLSNQELKGMIENYYKIIGPYTLILDNIYDEGKEYKYNHHNYLFNHDGLLKYFHKVDKLRSLYCLRIDYKKNDN